MNLRKAERQQARIKLGLQGPSGSGKTYSALKIAYGLTGDWSKICVIDSENNSSDLYAHLGHFNVLGIGQPFSPEKYIEAIQLAEKAGMEVIIIDSISHEWEGSGGILDIHSNVTGNSFTAWNKLTPRHNALIQCVLQSKAHVIATIRSKQDYVLSDKNGKMVPEKVGLKGVTRDNFDYDLTIVLELDIKHQATATKDRSGLFMDRPAFIPTEETGHRIKRWCHHTEDLDSIIADINGSDTIDQLRSILKENVHLRPLIKDALTRRSNELQRQMQ